MTKTLEPSYFAFLLRLWAVGDNQETLWRASLQDAHTGERRGFANPDELFEFLKKEMRPRRPPQETSGSR